MAKSLTLEPNECNLGCNLQSFAGCERAAMTCVHQLTTNMVTLQWPGLGGTAGKTCAGETLPVSNAAAYHSQPNPQDPILRRILAGMSKPVQLLDITFMTQLRKDGHTTKYSGDTQNGDCTHWCVPGVPDGWNTVFYWVLASGNSINSLRH